TPVVDVLSTGGVVAEQVTGVAGPAGSRVLGRTRHSVAEFGVGEFGDGVGDSRRDSGQRKLDRNGAARIKDGGAVGIDGRQETGPGVGDGDGKTGRSDIARRVGGAALDRRDAERKEGAGGRGAGNGECSVRVIVGGGGEGEDSSIGAGGGGGEVAGR